MEGNLDRKRLQTTRVDFLPGTIIYRPIALTSVSQIKIANFTSERSFK